MLQQTKELGQLREKFSFGRCTYWPTAIPQSVKVFTSSLTRFVGLTGLGDLTGTSPIRLCVVGLVLKNPNTGKPVIVARVVEKR